MIHPTLRRSVMLIALMTCGGAWLYGTPQQGDPKAKTVRLIIDYNDGVEKHFTRIGWAKGMTVLDAMKRAKASPHGIDFVYTGRGATAFLTQIDDLKNRGGGKENWIYRVNGKLATQGFGVQTLQSGDRVTWRFQKYRD